MLFTEWQRIRTRIVAGIILTLLIIGMLTLTFNIIHTRETSVRIVLYGDAHIGETIQAELDDASNFIRALNPDYILSLGDYIEQDNLADFRNDDTFQLSHNEWLKTFNMPMENIFHLVDSHDGWGTYDGYFRLLNETSTHWVRKIGNVAIVSLGKVGAPSGITRFHLDWFENTIRELAQQDYNIIVLKHIPLYHTNFGTSEEELWGDGLIATDKYIWVSEYISDIVNQYADHIIMIINGHIHIDATDVDSTGRGAFVDWRQVQGNSSYLQIETYLLNVAGISTTSHGHHYKSYQTIWYMDLTEGSSSITIRAVNIDTDPDTQVASHSVPLAAPLKILTEPVVYEHAWGPSKFPNNQATNINYCNDINASYQIYVKANSSSWFHSKFRFNTEVHPMNITINYDGNASAITKEIAYSQDGSDYSPFTEAIPLVDARYWKVRINITATTQVNISDVSLIVTP